MGSVIFTFRTCIHAHEEQWMARGVMWFVLLGTFYYAAGNDSQPGYLGLRTELQYLKGLIRTSRRTAPTVSDSLSHIM